MVVKMWLNASDAVTLLYTMVKLWLIKLKLNASDVVKEW